MNLVSAGFAWRSLTRITLALAFSATALLPAAHAQTKTPFHGLIAMGKIPAAGTSENNWAPDNTLEEPITHQNVYVGVDVNVTWAQLQPSSETSLTTTAIEAALTNIANYNAMSGITKPMKAKLRVYAGTNTPSWAMTYAGGSYNMVASNGTTQPFAKYWTSNYNSAWRNLQSMLAAIYDGDSRIEEVAISSCSSLSAEPFVSGADNATSRANMRTAGYTDALGEACLNNAATGDYAAWVKTPLDFSFNTFSTIGTSGAPVEDPDFSLQVMATYRTTFGTARGVIANHGLQDPLKPAAVPIYNGNDGYNGIMQSGPPIEFQMISQTPDGGWDTSVAYGRSYGATEIEVWVTQDAGGSAPVTLSQLQTWAAESW